MHVSTGYYRLLQNISGNKILRVVPIGYYKLLNGTTGYYRLLNVTTGYSWLLQYTSNSYRFLEVTIFFNRLLQVTRDKTVFANYSLPITRGAPLKNTLLVSDYLLSPVDVFVDDSPNSINQYLMTNTKDDGLY